MVLQKVLQRGKERSKVRTDGETGLPHQEVTQKNLVKALALPTKKGIIIGRQKAGVAKPGQRREA